MRQAISILVLFYVAISCTQPAKEKSSEEFIIPSHPWFKAEKIHEAVWRISDNGQDNIYLIEGRDSALLVDTGIGAVDLVDYIKKFTNLPLIVVNTHGHPDHVGSNNQFNTVYAHADEFGMIRNFTSREMHKTMLQYMVQTPIPDSVKYNPADTLHTARLLPVQDGYVIDLGDRKIEVIHFPGHTPGSICLLDRGNKLLFTGDNIKSLVWMHMEESVPLETYLKSLQLVEARATEFSTLLPGHDGSLDKEFISEQIICVQNIIAGKCESKPYESIVGNGMVCDYKRAQVAYDPKKLRR